MYALLSDTLLKLYYVQVPDLLKFNCEVQTRNTIYSKAKVLYNMNKPFCDEISQTYEAKWLVNGLTILFESTE